MFVVCILNFYLRLHVFMLLLVWFCFVCHMLYVLLLLTLHSDPLSLRTTTWHVDPEEDSDSEEELRKREAMTQNSEGLQLVANAAKRVWEELYVCKKPVSGQYNKTTQVLCCVAISQSLR